MVGRSRGRPGRSTIAAISILSACWLAVVLIEPLRALVEARLLVDASTIPDAEFWAVLSYAFFPRDLLALVFNGLMLWFFGADLERRWGAAKWWTVSATAAIAGGAIAAVAAWGWGAGPALGGWAAPVSALVAAYCRSFWETELHLFGQIRLTGRKLLIAFVAIDFVFALLLASPVLLAARLAGVGVGLAASDGRLRPGQLRRRYHHWRVMRNIKIVARQPEDDRKTPSGEWLN